VIGIDCGEDNDGTGVVLIRVPPSRLAPHRLIPTKDCYIRRADRTEKMTMAEIQASTLQSVNRHAEIEERLEARRKAHIHLVEVGGAIGRCRLGVRLTTLPIGAPVQLNRVYGNAEIFGMIRDFNILIDGKPGAINAPGSMRNINDFGVRPIFGGGRRSSDGQNNLWLTQEIHNDGMTELLFDVHDSEDNVLPLTNLLGILCNSLAVADRVRKAAGLPANEFLIDIEAMSAVVAPKLLDLPERQYLGVGDREQGLLNPNPLRLPRYTVGEPSGFENIVITVMNDFREAAGLRAVDGLTVDFE
jgi:hypothetical protein